VRTWPRRFVNLPFMPPPRLFTHNAEDLSLKRKGFKFILEAGIADIIWLVGSIYGKQCMFHSKQLCLDNPGGGMKGSIF
jgi:hypothetical protein